jgi:hypothetical protein
MEKSVKKMKKEKVKKGNIMGINKKNAEVKNEM